MKVPNPELWKMDKNFDLFGQLPRACRAATLTNTRDKCVPLNETRGLMRFLSIGSVQGYNLSTQMFNSKLFYICK